MIPEAVAVPVVVEVDTVVGTVYLVSTMCSKRKDKNKGTYWQSPSSSR